MRIHVMEALALTMHDASTEQFDAQALTLCRRCVIPGIKAVRMTADVPTLLKNVSGPDCVMLFVNS